MILFPTSRVQTHEGRHGAPRPRLRYRAGPCGWAGCCSASFRGCWLTASALWVSVDAYLFSHRNRRSGWGCWNDSHRSGVILPWEGSNSGARGTGEETRSSCLHRHSAGPCSGSHSLQEKQSLVLPGLFHKLAIAEFSSLALTQNLNQKLEISLSKS